MGVPVNVKPSRGVYTMSVVPPLLGAEGAISLPFWEWESNGNAHLSLHGVR
jgi:hypothetical protein